MRLIFFLIFIGVPLIELALLIKVGEVIGIAATIALVILTAVIGVSLLRRQGMMALRKAQESMQAGRPPIDSVIDGVCLLLAGAFLLTPGLLTDTVGFLLLVPQIRSGIAGWAFKKMQQSGQVDINIFGGPGGPAGPRGPRRPPPRQPKPEPRRPPGPIIEGEFTDLEAEPEKPEKTKPSGPPGSSPWRK